MSDTNNYPVWPGWETVRLIGRGSYGAVYEIARDILGDRETAAMKVISIPQSSSEIDELQSAGYDDESITDTFKEHLRSIISEYSLMRKLNGHSNVVNCDDVRYVQHSGTPGWTIFIKMELLTPLTKALGKEIPEKQTIRIGKDLCRALILCRAHSIIHRDIKPANIFFSPNGNYKLGDFGIAKTVEKTSGGTRIGTYDYMAPEVYHDQPYGSGADIYSLGMVLYWLLNERRGPFLPLPPAMVSISDKEQARRRRFAGEQLPPPAHGSETLRQIVLKACAFDPADRFQTADEMLSALELLSGPAAAEAPRPEAAPPAAPVRITEAPAEPVEAPAPEPETKPASVLWGSLGSAVPAVPKSEGSPPPVPAARSGPAPGPSRLLSSTWNLSGAEDPTPPKAPDLPKAPATTPVPAAHSGPAPGSSRLVSSTWNLSGSGAPAAPEDQGLTQAEFTPAPEPLKTLSSHTAPSRAPETTGPVWTPTSRTEDPTGSSSKTVSAAWAPSFSAEPPKPAVPVPPKKSSGGKWVSLIICAVMIAIAAICIAVFGSSRTDQAGESSSAPDYAPSNTSAYSEDYGSDSGTAYVSGSDQSSYYDDGADYVPVSQPDTVWYSYPTYDDLMAYMEYYSGKTVSDKKKSLQLPGREDLLDPPIRAKAKSTKKGHSILIMPMPAAGNGNLGGLKDGEPVWIMAKKDGYYFFWADNGLVGWNGAKYFVETD